MDSKNGMGVSSIGMSGHDDGGHAAASTWTYYCDGTPWFPYGDNRPSNWAVHFFAGITLLAWGLHWMSGVCSIYFKSSHQKPYHALPSQRLPLALASLPIEAVLKIVLPCIAIFTQLWWAHGHWWSLTCPDWEPRAGHIDPTHIDSWINAWSLFMFMVSGIVDLLAESLDLPAGIEHTFLGLAFLLQTLILAHYPRIDAFDQMMYFLLFIAAAGTTITVFLELVLHQFVLVSFAKVFFVFVQGSWYLASARYMYEGRVAWETHKDVGNEHQHDMAPAMFVPVMYCLALYTVSASMMAVLLSMRWWHSHSWSGQLKATSGVEKTFAGKGVNGSASQELKTMSTVGSAKDGRD